MTFILFPKSLREGAWPDAIGFFSCGSILSQCLLGTIEIDFPFPFFFWLITDGSQLSFNE